MLLRKRETEDLEIGMGIRTLFGMGAWKTYIQSHLEKAEKCVFVEVCLYAYIRRIRALKCGRVHSVRVCACVCVSVCQKTMW